MTAAPVAAAGCFGSATLPAARMAGTTRLTRMGAPPGEKRVLPRRSRAHPGSMVCSPVFSDGTDQLSQTLHVPEIDRLCWGMGITQRPADRNVGDSIAPEYR